MKLIKDTREPVLIMKTNKNGNNKNSKYRFLAIFSLFSKIIDINMNKELHKLIPSKFAFIPKTLYLPIKGSLTAIPRKYIRDRRKVPEAKQNKPFSIISGIILE
jgi:hypothetical protein